MNAAEMDKAINDYIGRCWGTEIAERLYRRRRMIWEDDFAAIEALYKEFEEALR
ncbi:MAG: hypothetical protein ACK5L3_06535 [Oscillospiraceae bacterium]